MRINKTVMQRAAKLADKTARKAHSKGSVWLTHQPKEPKLPEKKTK